MTGAEGRRLTDWATQAPRKKFISYLFNTIGNIL